MSLSIYSSHSRQKEEFQPLVPGKVSMYVCGVTVYDDPHIGHARCYVAFDAIHRHFLSKGWRVTYVRNFTDVDDKIINRANERGEAPQQLAERYIASFTEDMDALGVLQPSLEPRATQHIDEIIATVQVLIEKGHAYPVQGGDVYFSVASFAGYGKLSGRDIEDLRAGSRVAVNELKKNPLDFALWKASKPGEPQWESPWGPGRPGWHIECSVMSAKYLGATFDIHGGGKDLIFPHHENEVAQAEAASGQPFANYWVHNGFVRVNQEKMSKSLGNFFTIKDILKTTRPEALRLFLLGSHYRSPLDFSDEALVEAANGLTRLYNALNTINTQVEPGSTSQRIVNLPDRKIMAEIDGFAEAFEAAMDDDFNTAGALGAVFGLARHINRLAKQPAKPERDALLALAGARLKHLGRRLGLLNQDPEEFLKSASPAAEGVSPEEIEALIEARAAARKGKDFAKADAIRDQLVEMGVILQDSATGTTWQMKG